jgi:hypothetical protein
MKTLISISKNLKEFLFGVLLSLFKFLIGMFGKLKAKGEELIAGAGRYGGGGIINWNR